MNTTVTPRQKHARRLCRIQTLAGHYNRRFSFKEARDFLAAVRYYTGLGYPTDRAVQYAYDHYAIDRQVKRGTFRHTIKENE